jgi:hypothetical protein
MCQPVGTQEPEFTPVRQGVPAVSITFCLACSLPLPTFEQLLALKSPAAPYKPSASMPQAVFRNVFTCIPTSRPPQRPAPASCAAATLCEGLADLAQSEPE